MKDVWRRLQHLWIFVYRNCADKRILPANEKVSTNRKMGVAMKLVIGGTAQGKLEYVLSKYNVPRTMVWDGVLPNDVKSNENIVVINHLQQWIKSCMINGGCPEDEIRPFLDSSENCIIICDEIGNGIVPKDSFERAYRERVGRILVQLAKRAEEVERVICGIGQKIK